MSHSFLLWIPSWLGPLKVNFSPMSIADVGSYLKQMGESRINSKVWWASRDLGTSISLFVMLSMIYYGALGKSLCSSVTQFLPLKQLSADLTRVVLKLNLFIFYSTLKM